MEALRTKNSVGGKQNHLAVAKQLGAEELKLRRIAGLEPGGPGEPWRSMLAAVARHEEETLDPLATFGTAPLSHSEAGAMMDHQCVVSGYRLLPLKTFCTKTEFEVEWLMAGMLTDAPLEEMEWEAVWALGDSVLVYIRGSMA